jgi:hypothetical protein
MHLVSPICSNWNLVGSSMADHDLLAACEPRGISTIDLHRISRHQAGPKGCQVGDGNVRDDELVYHKS